MTPNIFSFSAIGPRVINQVLFSLLQVVLNLVFLRYFSISEYGAITTLQILINFYMGFNVNSLIYYCNFSIVSKTKIFLKISIIFFCLLFFSGTFLTNLLKVQFIVALLLMIRIHNNVLLEFNNRLTFNVSKNYQLYRFSLIRFIELISLFLFSFIIPYNVEFILIFLIVFEIVFFIFSFSLIRHSFKLDIFEQKNERINKNLGYNILYYLTYFTKAQLTPVILSIMSLKMMGIFSGTRFFAAPLLILTPVLSSLLLSSHLSINLQLKNIKDRLPIIIIGIITYCFLVLFLSKYFYLYFFEEFNSELLIFTFLHILLAILATSRSLIESIYQTKKYAHELLKVNLVVLAIALILTLFLIYIAGINGAIISMITVELTSILILKLKYENIL